MSKNKKAPFKQPLDNQVVWITGASAGIGEALAIELAKQGARLVLSARRAPQLQRVADRCQLINGLSHMVLPFDVTDRQAAESAYQMLIAECGHLDWLINNAGVSQRALVLDTLPEVDRQIMALDYFAPVDLTRLVLPDLLARRSGRLVYISSVAGLVGTQYRASYAAAKAAIHLWANSLRAEVADQGIQVSVIFPGFVNTDVSVNALVGDGTALGSMDEAQANAMAADAFAAQAVRGLLRGQDYLVIGGAKERFATLLGRVSPSMLYRVVRRSQVR
ncbi:MAG: SDR family oxidoreductase [Pseudomonadota bacterium]|nr:SDR family oxidoreductase [Pseudomonadota bacterium]